MSAAHDFALEDTQPINSLRPSPLRSIQSVPGLTSDNSTQAAEEAMSRYTIPELETICHSSPAKGDSIQHAESTSPEPFSAQSASLTTVASPKVINSSFSPPDYLKPRDVNRQLSPKNQQPGGSKPRRYKFVSKCPPMIIPPQDTVPVTPAPTPTPDPVSSSPAGLAPNAAPTDELGKPRVIVNLPTAPIAPQHPSLKDPSTVNDIPSENGTKALPHLQISSASEVPHEHTKDSIEDTKSSLLPEKSSAANPLGGNEISSIAVAPPSEGPSRNVADGDLQGGEQQSKVNLELTQKMVQLKIDDFTSFNPKLGTENPMQPQKRRNSKWPSKESLKNMNMSGRQRAGSNDWGSATSSQYKIERAVSSVGEVPDEQHFEHQLAGWDGNWAPPPIEWDARPGFYRSSQDKVKQLEDWMASVVANGRKVLDTTQITFADGTAHTAITTTGELELVIPPEVPEARIDRDDPISVAQQMQTAEFSALKYSNRALVQEKEKKKRMREMRTSAAEYSAYVVYTPNPHEPKARIYIRPARICDMQQITGIYGYYIENSIYVPERELVNVSDTRISFQHVVEASLPWFVAVELPTSAQNRRQPEKILGYGFADDFGARRGSYRYTVEIEIYVHHQHLRLGIGKSLIDKLMGCLDPHYTERGGYHFNAGGEEHHYCQGGLRVISKVIVTLPYEQGDDARPAWVGNWLNQWEFNRVGTLEGVGFKLKKQINIAQFQKTTGSAMEFDS